MGIDLDHQLLIQVENFDPAVRLIAAHDVAFDVFGGASGFHGL
jgi:hypothetical protein